MNNPRAPDRSPAAARAVTAQASGSATSPATRARTGAQPGTHLVRDDETGITYAFGYADIVTEGLRSLRAGERVRFLIDQARPGHATYVIRLDLPDITELYT